jgi:hypothetical protein
MSYTDEELRMVDGNHWCGHFGPYDWLKRKNANITKDFGRDNATDEDSFPLLTGMYGCGLCEQRGNAEHGSHLSSYLTLVSAKAHGLIIMSLLMSFVLIITLSMLDTMEWEPSLAEKKKRATMILKGSVKRSAATDGFANFAPPQAVASWWKYVAACSFTSLAAALHVTLSPMYRPLAFAKRNWSYKLNYNCLLFEPFSTRYMKWPTMANIGILVVAINYVANSVTEVYRTKFPNIEQAYMCEMAGWLATGDVDMKTGASEISLFLFPSGQLFLCIMS